MGVIVNVETLRNFEAPLVQNSNAFVEVLASIKKCRDAIGEGTGVEEAIERDGIALEKAYNDEVVPSIQTVLSTLAASADNAEEIRKTMASFDAVNTARIAETQVEEGVRPAAFTRG